MRGGKTLLYILSIAGFIAVLYFVLSAGKGLQAAHMAGVQYVSSGAALKHDVASAFRHPLPIFILQLAMILVASQVFGYLFKKIGQPAVMGEIVAGILLGPSLMGALLPGFSAFLFPATSMGNLQMLSQVGLILFMFVIGMELDIEVLKKQAGAAILISHFSIVIPFASGVALAYFLYEKYAPAGVTFYAFALFTGIALSITAFPVLARIIKERGIANTKLGTIALTAAAVGDVTAWCALALIIAIARAGSLSASLYTIMWAVVHVAVMFFVIRPLLQKLAVNASRDKLIKRSRLAIIFLIMLGSAYACEIIGIHALFGAFLAGVIMPHDWNFRKLLIDKIEDVALVLLLPLFFVFTGLRTHIGLINNPALWGVCLIIIAVAVAGKFGGSALAAKLAGERTKDSLSIGALMNTRGLVELVVLNIGYDMHILTPEIFTMMVMMALVTTFMTNPLMNIIERVYK